MRTGTLLAALTLVCAAAWADNLVLYGDFEGGAVGDRAPQFWHRVGNDYRSAYPDWRLTGESAAAGTRSVVTDTEREFIVGAECQAGWGTGSVSMRADQPGTPAVVRLSWWNRLNRVDETKEVVLGPEWQRFEIRTEIRQGGPVELAVRSAKAGARVFADDFRIAARPKACQFTDYRRVDGEMVRGTVEPIRPEPFDLAPLQEYGGEGRDSAGRVPLRVEAPVGDDLLPYVSGGVPFPKGTLFRRERCRVADAEGRPVDAQFDVLARWPDDSSVMMLLVTVPTPEGDAAFSLEFGPEVAPATEQAEFSHPSESLLLPIVLFATDSEGVRFFGSTTRRVVQLSGPLRRVVALEGERRSEGGARLGRHVTRFTFWPGSNRYHVSHAWIHDQKETQFAVNSAGFRLPRFSTGPHVTFWESALLNPETGTVELAVGETGEGATSGPASRFIAPRDFAMNHPMKVEVGHISARVFLWPEEARPVLLPQGFCRQWEFLVCPDGTLAKPFDTASEPLLYAEPQWMCDSGVFEFIMPPDPETFPVFERRVAGWDTLGKWSAANKERHRLHGVFNYGDAPGDGGWANLESMADHELFLHWMRGEGREHYDMARLAAEHYRDMDIHHGAGFCHTHCNNHVASGESWGHAWIQGVRDLYFLRGDLHALDTLRIVGERLLDKPAGFTTGRDWTRALDCMVDIYGATGDPRYRKALLEDMAEIGRRQLPEHAVPGAERFSWYEDRYTSGVAFTWYGCQAMAKLHLLTGEDSILDVLRKEIELGLDVQTKSVRSHNILPDEEVCRDHQAMVLGNWALGRGSTLFPPLGYLAHATGERHFLDLGMDILAHYMLNMTRGHAPALSYATVFMRYAREAGLGPEEEAAAFQRAMDYSYERWPKGIVNGGFEMDNFAHWSVKKVPGQNYYYDDLVRVGYYLDEEVKRSGNRSLRLRSDNRRRTMTVRGRFALEPLRRYRASLWYRADESMNPRWAMSLREYDTDTSRGIRLRPTGVVEDGWAEVAGEFATGPRAVLTVALSNRTGTGDAWFDDVALEDLGKLDTLLTGNGVGREWDRRPPYPGIPALTDGFYLPDKAMTGEHEEEGEPILFTKGALTDGVDRYDWRQEPRNSYAYWGGREQGSILFDLGRKCVVKRVRYNTLIVPERRSHGARRVELRLGGADGPVLAAHEPTQSGWNEFEGLNVETQQVTIVMYLLDGYRFLTLSEVEIWGEPL